MGAGNGQAALSAGDFAQGAGAFQKHVTLLAGFHQFSQIGRNGGGVNHQRLVLIGRNKVRPVLVVHRNTFGLQLMREVGGCTVVSRHLEALELVVTCQCGHSDSADSYEINVLHTSL